MSREMSIDDLKKHLSECIKSLSDLLNDWANAGCKESKKRSMILAYWIKTYVSFLKREKTFKSTSLPRFKRGSVIQVDFGYRIGSELGGLHYAVVLNTSPAYSATSLTVIPLSSQKDTTKHSAYKVKLQDGIYELLCIKTTELIEQGKKLLDEAEQIKYQLSQEREPEKILRLQSEFQMKREMAKAVIDKAEKTINNAEHLKMGSVALIGQITTISKIRISRPVNKADILYNIKLSEKDLDLINESLKELYIFEKK